MTGAAVLTPRARGELRQALATIAQDNVQAARAFNDSVAKAAQRLGTSPGLGSQRPYLPPPYRAWPLRRYSYLLIYDPSSQPVQILRIVHMRRDLPRILSNLLEH